MNLARALLVSCLALVPLTQSRIDSRFGQHRAAEEILYLWSGEDVRRLFPGLESLMADVYWLRTVQYFGGQRVFGTERKFEVLEPLIDITVTLDPRFEIAYRYGATFLSEPWPIGAGRPEAGARILERGARANPRSWFIRQNLAFLVFFHLGDATRAAHVLLESASLPGAPTWFEPMAADFLSRGEERETARKMWLRMYEQAEEGPLRKNALSHLEYMEAEDTIARLSLLVQEFAKRTGRKPKSLEELQRAGLIRSVPADPAGTPFDYDEATGEARVSEKSRLFRNIIKPRPQA